MSKQPMQPIVKASGRFWFESNRVVQWLYAQTSYNMDDLTGLGFSDGDMEQFAQLLGFNVHEFYMLPFVTEETASEVERERLKVQDGNEVGE